MNYLYLDIETIPSQSPDLLAKFRAEVSPPATYKKPESIAEWMAENADRVAQEQMDKTGLDPAYGHICTIAWAGETGAPDVLHARTVEQESDVIRGFFAAMPAETWGAPCFVGHFISGFDLRFILCRAVVLGIRIPAVIPRDPKPWDGRVFDTMTAWAGARGAISMDRLCGALGLEGKAEGLDGSQVGKAWAEGRHEEIIRYCAGDVERTRAIHQRFIAAGF
jgi:3'-5' exonuclease